MAFFLYFQTSQKTIFRFLSFSKSMPSILVLAWNYAHWSPRILWYTQWWCFRQGITGNWRDWPILRSELTAAFLCWQSCHDINKIMFNQAITNCYISCDADAMLEGTATKARLCSCAWQDVVTNACPVTITPQSWSSTITVYARPGIHLFVICVIHVHICVYIRVGGTQPLVASCTFYAHLTAL